MEMEKKWKTAEEKGNFVLRPQVSCRLCIYWIEVIDRERSKVSVQDLVTSAFFWILVLILRRTHPNIVAIVVALAFIPIILYVFNCLLYLLRLCLLLLLYLG